MKIVKHYWFVAIALITMISFSSCESDEERGFDISGLYGKTWCIIRKSKCSGISKRKVHFTKRNV